ncbi:PilW family protein [Leeia sp.]|uniref:PilW family protein n=1 Tax=Leeia sp. TaxID=2884678 RepID=UPI0035AD95FF
MKQVLMQRGFSLVELMVSLTLGSLVILALGQIYSSTSASRRVQEMQSRLAEDGRFVMGISSRLLLQAGYRSSPVYGTPFQSINASVSTASSVTFTFDTDAVNQIGCNGTVEAASGTNRSVTIAQSSTGLNCTYNNGTAATTNWVVAAASGTSRGVEVVDFNLQYGVDTGNNTGAASSYQCATAADCIPDSYTSTPTAGARIVAVRVCTVLRSEQTAMAVSRPTAFTNCTGGNIAASTSDRKVYRIFRTTVAMRNRS